MDTRAPYIVAVDQSTQATKAYIFDRAGATVAKASLPHRQLYPAAGWVEHDPEEILRTTYAVIVEAVRSSGVKGDSLAALSITNQRESIVAWDRKTGLPFYNVLVWQDERGAPLCGELKAAGAGKEVRERTGLVLDTFFSASKLAWLVDHSSEARAALGAGNLMAGTIDSWLIWNLTGQKVFATDYSNASRTMLFNIEKLEWDPALIRLFGLNGAILPEPRCSDAWFGDAILRDLEISLPIRGVMGDSHAALFGHCGWNVGDTKATYGTGSSIMSNVGFEKREAPEGIVSSLAWGLNDRAAYVFEGNIQASGYTMKWLRDNLGIFQDDREAERIAEEVKDNGGVYFVPAFSGLGAPYWKHGIRAMITGLSHGSDKRHIVRAGLESIAFQVMDLVEAIGFGASTALGSLHVDGGPSRNGFLMQFQADLLGIPVVAPERDELSALGVAFMGGLGAGIWVSLDELASLNSDARRYLPKMGSDTRGALASGWKTAVAQAMSRGVE